jgi:hypothetical protein
MPLPATQPPKGDSAYRQLWEIVDRAVRDAFDRHPEYLTDAGRQAAVQSVNKRVVGAVIGHLAQRRLEAGALRNADELAQAVLRAAVELLLLEIPPQEFVAELKAAFPTLSGE